MQHRIAWGWLASFSLALSIVGCTVAPEHPIRDAAFGDVGLNDGGPVDANRDAFRPDGAMAPDANGAGLLCSACTSNADCNPGSFCVTLAAGQQVCLVNCNAEIPSCPHRFDCITSILTPTAGAVCTPVGERCCVDADEDDHGLGVGCRGTDCNDENHSVYQGATESCNGIDDNCDGTIDDGNPGGGAVCSTGMPGACSSGVSVCQAGATVCQPGASTMPETCNGIDDDCDAQVDEGAGGTTLTQVCYDGVPASTAGVGMCAAGRETCTGGMFRGCVGQVLPATESCNSIDDDCDGVVDDGNPGGGAICSTGLGGACSPGILTCAGGTLHCVGNVMPGTVPEICDAIDNNCDGAVNEGFPNLGALCTGGVGACRRSGIITCNPANSAAAPICDAVLGTPNLVEQCDYVDDNCNGSVDEGYRNAAGQYLTITHCGACGVDCNVGWAGGPAAYNVVPTCTPAGSSALCSFACIGGAFDADGFRDNGCEFFPEPTTIYVSTPMNGGADVAGCGDFTQPCGTIGGGILRAVATSRPRVRVSTGLFVENVTLSNGVSVIGGHSHTNWVHNPSVFATTLRGSDMGGAAGGINDRLTVTAIGIDRATELSGFTIQAVNGGPSGNSIAIYVRDSTNNLLIQQNEIIAGAGGNGTAGSPGFPGTNGAAGSAGGGPLRAACPGSGNSGGSGGARSCSGVLVSGGSGGGASSPTTSGSTRQPAGSSGSSGLGGAGGLGGFNVEGTMSAGTSTCTIYMSPTEASLGSAGLVGSDASGGSGAASGTGFVVFGQWRAGSGSFGLGGNSGGGGGGGGTPGGVDATAYCLFPATGGGGGSGGCAGSPGSGGTGAGASFAIFMLFSAAPTVATVPVVQSNDIRRGLGGRGGDGGTGGGGGDGGRGGAGGPRTSGSTAGDSYEFCLASGAAGGDGGRGGHAGGGGGGAGGASYDIWVSRPGFAAPTFPMNVYEVPASTVTSGGGGVGGNSSNTSIGIGGPGVSGSSGTVHVGT